MVVTSALRFSHTDASSQAIALVRATPNDFEAIHAIWMQPHVLPFLGFEQTPFETFKPVLEETMACSDVYVLKKEQVIVAVGRLIPRTGGRSHTLEFGSFAVHSDHLRKGYADVYFKKIIAHIQTTMPHITKFEMGQTSDNEPARLLAIRLGFTPECIFPERPLRKTGDAEYTRKWHVAARYVMRMLTQAPINRAMIHVREFEPTVPALRALPVEGLTIEQQGKSAILRQHGVEIARFTMAQWTRRFEHIQYWEMTLVSQAHPDAVRAGFRELLLLASQQCKKIEMFAEDQPTADALCDMGFYCRGLKKNAYKIGDVFHDEIGADISFFNIQHAATIVKTYVERDRASPVLLALVRCKHAIMVARQHDDVDAYGAMYLENMAFQMVRETFGEPAMRRYGQAGQAAPPWAALIDTLPAGVKDSFVKLGKFASPVTTERPKMYS